MLPLPLLKRRVRCKANHFLTNLRDRATSSLVGRVRSAVAATNDSAGDRPALGSVAVPKRLVLPSSRCEKLSTASAALDVSDSTANSDPGCVAMIVAISPWGWVTLGVVVAVIGVAIYAVIWMIVLFGRPGGGS